MKILVISTDYPRPDGYVSQFFIHTRNKEYVRSGLDVTVMSFTATKNYTIDDVNVITREALLDRIKSEVFDVLISHAPNLRNHYRFLIKYGDKFKKFVFFFHGHEVLRGSQIYPKSYAYTKNESLFYKVISETYDTVKLFMWKNFFEKHLNKTEFVFVSKWMEKMFLKYVKLDSEIFKNRTHIIYNSIGLKFEKEIYDQDMIKKYDFLTIRNMLDKSKYAIDIVLRMAKKNPSYKFCIIGKGDFFKFNKKPDNIELISKHLTHDEIVYYLNQSRCALMPTRADAQGVMMCEMATFGIPLITSDIDVCNEVLKEFNNVKLINNESFEIDLTLILNKLTNGVPYSKNLKYSAINTSGKEVELLQEISK